MKILSTTDLDRETTWKKGQLLEVWDREGIVCKKMNDGEAITFTRLQVVEIDGKKGVLLI